LSSITINQASLPDLLLLFLNFPANGWLSLFYLPDHSITRIIFVY